jgi:hypothetical protein
MQGNVGLIRDGYFLMKIFLFIYLSIFQQINLQLPDPGSMKCGLERGSVRRTPGCHDESFQSGPRHREKRGISFFLHSSCCRFACEVCHLRCFHVLMTIFLGRELVGPLELSFREAGTEYHSIQISRVSVASTLVHPRTVRYICCRVLLPSYTDRS